MTFLLNNPSQIINSTYPKKGLSIYSCYNYRSYYQCNLWDLILSSWSFDFMVRLNQAKQICIPSPKFNFQKGSSMMRQGRDSLIILCLQFTNGLTMCQDGKLGLCITTSRTRIRLWKIGWCLWPVQDQIKKNLIRKKLIFLITYKIVLTIEHS